MSENSVKFIHVRLHDTEDNVSSVTPTTRGGSTFAYQVDGEDVKYAVAHCSPKDNYCRATGRAVSKGRLLSIKASNYSVVLPVGTNPVEVVLNDFYTGAMSKEGTN